MPSCWSVAEPEKEIVSPTFHVVVEGGVFMVAVGGVLPRAYGERLIEGVRGSLAVGHPELDLVGALLV